jgi:phage gpG-like protein
MSDPSCPPSRVYYHKAKKVHFLEIVIQTVKNVLRTIYSIYKKIGNDVAIILVKNSQILFHYGVSTNWKKQCIRMAKQDKFLQSDYHTRADLSRLYNNTPV